MPINRMDSIGDVPLSSTIRDVSLSTNDVDAHVEPDGVMSKTPKH